jgi:hypothetical protein
VIIVRNKQLISLLHVFENKFTIIKSENIGIQSNPRNHRSSNQTPLSLCVGYLVVIDNLVYQKYQNLYDQLSDDLVLKFLQIYYSQMVNAVRMFRMFS